MAEEVLFADDVDVGDLGFGIMELGAWWSGVERIFEHSSPYSALKSIPAPDGTTPPVVRPLRMLWAGTIQDREGALDSLRRAFPLGRDVRVRLGDSDRYAFARRNSDLVDVLEPADWVTGDVVCQVPLTLYDPARYSATDIETPLSDVPAVVDVGTLPSDWSVEIEGPATDPEIVVSLVDESIVGAALYSFPMTGEIATGARWVVDFATHTITLVPAVGAPTNMLSAFPIGAVDINGNPARFRGLGTGAEEQVAVHLTSGVGTMTHTNRWG